MKLVFPGIHHVIEIKQGYLNSLVIENPSLLLGFISDLKDQMNKMDGMAVLSKKDVPIDICKNVELVTDIYGMDFHSKAIMAKVLDELNEKAMSPEFYERTQTLMAAIETFTNDLIWDLDCEITYPILYPKQIIKAMNMTIEDENSSLIDRIFEYTQLVQRFLGDKLFIFVNYRGFIEQEQFKLLAETLVSHDVKVLFLDNKDYPRLSNENRWTIDVDLCEF